MMKKLLLKKSTKALSYDNKNRLEAIVVARATTEKRLIQALEDELRMYCFELEDDATRSLLTEEELEIIKG